MQVLNVEQNTEQWFELRKGKVTGSKKIRPKRGNNRLDGFYELAADKLETGKEDMSATEQGHVLEPRAIAAFEELTGKTVETNMMWISDDNPDIAISPDGAIKDKNGVYTEATEVKCLAGKNYIRAVEENAVPSDYSDQALQYFVVNPDLKTLYFVFYDPYITAKPLHVIEMHRTEELQKEVDEYKAFQLKTLAEVNEIVERWSF